MLSKSTPPPPVDWRQAAEDRGKAVFEAAVAPEPEPTPPPWWKSPKGKKESSK